MKSSPPKRILIVEDEPALSLALAATVQNCRAVPETVPSLAKARKILGSYEFSGIVLDVGLPDGNGLSLLESLPESERLPTIVVTAHGEIENAIAARKLGCREFFDKPVDFEAFKTALTRILREPKNTVPAPPMSATYIGGAPSMRPVFQQIAHCCASIGPVLVTGETGAGKTATASLIFDNTLNVKGKEKWKLPDSDADVIKALDETIERCSNGVLLFDPITSLPPESQAHLVSRWEADPANFPRIIATAPPDLREMVEHTTFRNDLYYRLQVMEIRLPPLRDRTGDIPILVGYFLGMLEGSHAVTASEDLLQHLATHDWPGNLRELRNVVSYAHTVGSGSYVLEPSHLPDHLLERSAVPIETADTALSSAIEAWLGETDELPPYHNISARLEKRLLKLLLARFDGKLSRLASRLDANRTTLRKKLQYETDK